MKQVVSRAIAPGVLTLFVLGGCMDAQNLVDSVTGGQVLGITQESSDLADGSDEIVDSQTPVVAEASFTDKVQGYGDYRLFKLGACSAGEQWEIGLSRSSAPPLIVVLFDQDQNLLTRRYISSSTNLTHILRESTSETYLGVATQASIPTEVAVSAEKTSGVSVPAPRAQVVYLNFDGGQGVRVHAADPITFSAFDAADLGSDYAASTALIQQVIMQTLADDFAAFNVEFRMSSLGPPAGEYSTLHFGGYADSLLGLADSVDEYNSRDGEDAIIYVESFSAYSVMRLTPEEMAVMIGNVASHELGHLLGLYHTQDPDDIMDTTGTAADLAESQSFLRARLENSVFPTGFEDSAGCLALGVGPRAATAKVAAASRGKVPMHQVLRRFMKAEMPSACGTCRHLDD
ncbi:MAG: matrixin family metalloprotease [Phycisphaerae bacterium]